MPRANARACREDGAARLLARPHAGVCAALRAPTVTHEHRGMLFVDDSAPANRGAERAPRSRFDACVFTWRTRSSRVAVATTSRATK
jgi:hypothetical protein